MKNIFITLGFLFSVCVSLAVEPFRSIRELDSVSQFDQAVENNDVFLHLNRNITFGRESDSEYAKKRIESVIPMKNSDGTLLKEIVMRCDFHVQTTAKKVTLAKTKTRSQVWAVKSVQKFGLSTERWIIGKPGQSDITLTCMAFERKGDEVTNISLVPNLVNKVMAEVGGKILTKSKKVVSDVSRTHQREDSSRVTDSAGAQ